MENKEKEVNSDTTEIEPVEVAAPSVAYVLSHVQRKLNAPKNQWNKFSEFHYRSCEDIFEGLKKVLPEGASVTATDEVVMIGDRTYIKATATLRYNNETISNTAFAREPLSKKGMDESQITGATSSYARKYALNGLFLIDDVKDADSRNNKEEAEDANQKLAAKRQQVAAAKPVAKSLTPNFDGIALADTPMPGKLNGQKLGTVDLTVLEGLRSGEHAQLFKTHYPEHWKRVDEYLNSL